MWSKVVSRSKSELVKTLHLHMFKHSSEVLKFGIGMNGF